MFQSSFETYMPDKINLGNGYKQVYNYQNMKSHAVQWEVMFEDKILNSEFLLHHYKTKIPYTA